MTRAFPGNDPFPAQATTRLPGDPVALNEIETSTLTLMRPALQRTADLIESYVSRYSSPSSPGQFVALIGEHGSGKTHTINYVAGRVAADWPPGGDDRNPFQVTVKVETAEIAVFYRTLFAQIKQQSLVGLMARARDQIAIDEFKSTTGTADDVERIRGNRDAAERLLTDYLVDRGAVATRQVNEIGRVGEGRGDFQRALPFLLGTDPMLATYAYRWMAGEPVEANGLRAIGVSGPLKSVEMFKSALEILAALFGRARRPFLLYIDQFEKLVAVAETREENVSVVRRLIDVVPSERGLLLIAGTREAWQLLPRDVRDRFGQNEIELPILTKQEAADLIRIFLDAGGAPSENDLFPFTQGAVDALARFARGNIRRLLQCCSTVYCLAQSKQQQIDVVLVEDAIRRDLLRPPADEREIAETIERLLESSGMRWRRNVHIYRQLVAYAIILSDGRPKVAIEVTRAVYKDDETRRADALVRLAEDVRNVGTPQSSVIAVVVGYSTREVATVIGSAVRQIFYDPRTFADDFRAALAATEAQQSGAARSENVDGELALLRAELKRMQDQRDVEVEALQERLAELLERSASTSAPTIDVVRERWHDECARIKGAIERARSERRVADFEKLRRASVAIDRERRERLIRPAAVAGLLILLATVLWFSLKLFLLFPYGETVFLVSSMFTAALVLIVASILWYVRFFEPADLHRLTRRVESLDELEQMSIANPSRAKRMLFHPHPQVRFLAARSATILPVKEMVQWLELEPQPLVRRAQALALARTRDVPFTEVPDRVPEAVYIAAALPSTGTDEESRRSIANLIGNGDLMTYFATYGDPLPLAQSFSSGEISLEVLTSLSRQTVKAALRMLSPFDEDGLGRFEGLRKIELVDELYLFWSEVLFLMERAKSRLAG